MLIIRPAQRETKSDQQSIVHPKFGKRNSTTTNHNTKKEKKIRRRKQRAIKMEGEPEGMEGPQSELAAEVGLVGIEGALEGAGRARQLRQHFSPRRCRRRSPGNNGGDRRRWGRWKVRSRRRPGEGVGSVGRKSGWVKLWWESRFGLRLGRRQFVGPFVR